MPAAAVEIARLLLSAYFSFAKLNNATDEELDILYNSSKDEFNQNDPNALEDI